MAATRTSKHLIVADISIQRMAKKSCPVLEHKQDGMGKRLRSGPEMWVRVLNGQVSQRLLQNCELRVRCEILSAVSILATGAFCPNPEPA